MSDGLPGLVRLTKKDAKPAGEMMALAFHQYPLTMYFHPDPEERLLGSVVRFETMIRYGITHGEVYATSPEMEGVAMWLSSDKIKATFWRNLRSGHFDRPWKKPLPKQANYGVFITGVRHRCAPFPHLYLRALGVHPDHRDKGLSSQLLRPMFERTDKEGLPCYLETQSELNVAKYMHLGFRVVDEQKVPGSDIDSWGMLREKST
ncbi:MAG: GNAT family N-acetyltransferase [Dehalococcoidales bacterium]|nr:GNAT family N-acetyltransferase [Dehalococcoidales bacterium]